MGAAPLLQPRSNRIASHSKADRKGTLHPQRGHFFCEERCEMDDGAPWLEQGQWVWSAILGSFSGGRKAKLQRIAAVDMLRMYDF